MKKYIYILILDNLLFPKLKIDKGLIKGLKILIDKTPLDVLRTQVSVLKTMLVLSLRGFSFDKSVCCSLTQK